jgi:hypothetical protein
MSERLLHYPFVTPKWLDDQRSAKRCPEFVRPRDGS